MKEFVLRIAAWSAAHLPMSWKQAFYKVGPLARLLRGLLNRSVPGGLSTVQVAAGGLAGCSFSLDLQVEKDYWLGTYEPDLQTSLDELLDEGIVAYDVGANIGYISLLLARGVGQAGRVYAFEALPANLKRLRANLALNDIGKRVQVIPGAVVDAPHPVDFLVGPSGGMGKAQGSAGREEYLYEQTLQVDGLSLDYFIFQLGNPAPQALKLDIEGGEVLALPGMARLLKEAPPLILMELHGEDAAKAAWDHLGAAGYRICAMTAGFPEITKLEQLDWKAYLIGFPPGFEPHRKGE